VTIHDVVERADEEARVLEVREEPEVEPDGQRQERLAPRDCARSVDREREDVVDDRRRHEQEDEAPVPPAVEDVAREQDPPAPRPLRRHQEPRDREDDQEEDRERGGREEHGARG
jgi:hypothetical protein